MDTNTVLVVAILALVIIVIAFLFRGQIAVLLNLPGNTSLSVNAKSAQTAPQPGAAIANSRTKGSAVAEANPGERAVIDKVEAEKDLRASTRSPEPSDRPKV